jgi:cysteine desulfurase/selenocysteine lyase
MDVRGDFPALQQRVHGRTLVYLDNAATTQMPRPVLDAIRQFDSCGRANIHRGVHALSARASALYDEARAKVARFIGASRARDIVFVRGTTEAINLVAATWGRQHLHPGDEVLLTTMEHHSNIVPWQLLGVRCKALPMDSSGALCMDLLPELLGGNTKLVAATHTSNAIGTVNPIADIVGQAKARGIATLVDAAQGVPHMKIDVHKLGCDFLAFSGHKMYGPMGIGALYSPHLQDLPPYQGGGGMIRSVAIDKSTYDDAPARFEAGTPNVSGAIGLAAAIDYIDGVGFDEIAAHEAALLGYLGERLRSVPKLRLVGEAAHRAAAQSFVMDDIHPHDIGTILDREGVAVRTGHHCAQPLMQHFKVPATARASLAMYSTTADVDALVAGLFQVRKVFGRE